MGGYRYLDDVESFVDGGFDVKGESGIDFCGDLAGNNLQDLFAEFDEEAIEGCVDFLIDVFALRRSASCSDRWDLLY